MIYSSLVDILAEIDIILAKAKYGIAHKCTKPEVNNEGYIRLAKARHPLLPIEKLLRIRLNLAKTLRQLSLQDRIQVVRPSH